MSHLFTNIITIRRRTKVIWQSRIIVCQCVKQLFNNMPILFSLYFRIRTGNVKASQNIMTPQRGTRDSRQFACCSSRHQKDGQVGWGQGGVSPVGVKSLCLLPAACARERCRPKLPIPSPSRAIYANITRYVQMCPRIFCIS